MTDHPDLDVHEHRLLQGARAAGAAAPRATRDEYLRHHPAPRGEEPQDWVAHPAGGPPRGRELHGHGLRGHAEVAHRREGRHPPGQERRDRARRGRPGEDHRQLPVRHHHEIVAPEELTDESTEESTEESTGMPTEEPTEEPTDEPCLEILMTTTHSAPTRAIHARHQATEEEIKRHDIFIGNVSLSISLGDDHDHAVGNDGMDAFADACALLDLSLIHI